MDAVPLATVLARPDVWRGDRFADAVLPAVASGFAALDRELPGGSWPRGALTELLCDGLFILENETGMTNVIADTNFFDRQ